MRTLPAFVLLASIGTVAIAQNQPPAPQQPPPSQQPKTAAPEAKPAAEIDPQLQKVMKAYSQADNLSDTIKLDVKTPMGNQEQEMKVVLGEGTDSQMSMTGLSMTFHGGKLYMVRDDVADKYFVTAVEGGIFTTVENVLGNTGLLPMHILLSTDELKSDEDVLNAITMGAVPQPRITGTTTVKNDDGQDMQELKFEGQGGQGTVQVDPKTNLVHKVAVQVTPQGAPPGTVIDATMTMSPKVAEGAAKIAFEPGARTAVSSLDELKPTPVAVGQPAPDFTLATLEGEQVTLSSLKGSAVILDFWATWCGPCKMALPKLQEFADWTKESGQPVKVFAIDTWERGKPEDVRKQVGDFWTSKKYTFPTLMDLDSSVVGRYGFSSIPTTVVVGPDGKIFKIHSGFSQNMVDMLKTDVEEALKSSS